MDDHGDEGRRKGKMRRETAAHTVMHHFLQKKYMKADVTFTEAECLFGN